MKNFWLYNKFYIISVALFFIITVVLAFIDPNLSMVEFYLFCYNSKLIFFAYFITIFGSFLWFLPVLVWIFLKHKKFFKATLIYFSLVLLTVFIFKRLFNLPRPFSVFQNFDLPTLVFQRKLYFFSFPSGHTAVAFAWANVLIFLAKKNIFKILFTFLAISVALSRVCLFQHFWRDVAFSIFLAFLFFLLIFHQKNFFNEFDS